MIFGKKVITWSRIGEVDGNDLLLCDTVFDSLEFGKTNEYESSTVRKRCRELYNECFSEEERNCLVEHPIIGDHVFLLSKEEYLKHKYVINTVRWSWWLRSPGSYPNSAAYVYVDGGVSNDYVSYGYLVLRPAIILRKE